MTRSPGLDPADAGAGLDHLAGGVAAARPRLGWLLAGSQAEHVKLAEFCAVQRRCVDADQHVTGCDHGSLNIADVPGAARGAGDHDCRLHVFPFFAGIIQASDAQ
jgi:hypothetical protein